MKGKTPSLIQSDFERRQPEEPVATRLQKIIKNEALIEMEPSLHGLTASIDQLQGGAIYYGTGVATPDHMSVGLPFDVLSMILICEKIKKQTGARAIYHHIADTHATTNRWADTATVNRTATNVRNVLTTVTNNLGLEGFHVTLSSEFDTDPEYLEMLHRFDTSDKHDYVKHEMADMLWYRQKHGVTLKAGWIIQSAETQLGADERLFDREFQHFEGQDALSFIYIKAGRTFDLSRPKASPYIQIPGENRLLLDPNENARQKMDEAVKRTGDYHIGGARKHIKSIVRLYESLYGSLGKSTELEDKVQAILDHAFGRAEPKSE